ncbi:serine/threonine-protein kinase/endoribonuclease IRE1a isoform X1 [Cinnamomum micranthum f. kanehirae]|uniref:Serine/threonine-protein kinase/endoribonuclease IRE1a isoform X1 n=1 Tax=Cinnamomum micranthum f. kanehirae TaxID=337451 RepID=A0A3S3R8E9_9MAGN|nr:serine/threonine-protein kinase/endoribonuclease IRE1a isoform X1 [Cinnamomum micranthum f. kanehirae]
MNCFGDTSKLVWNMTVGYIKHICHCFDFGKTYNGDGMPFLGGVKVVVYCSDERNPLHFELKSLGSRDEDEVILLPVTQPSSSSVLNMSPNQLGKGANDYVIGFLVLLGFVIIVALLHYRWWRNRVQPNRQPCELNEQRKGKNHAKSKKAKNEKSKNYDSTSQWKNKSNGSTSQGHKQLEDEEECIPEFSLERDNDSTSQGNNKNNGSTSQGHIQLEDEKCIPELSFKRDGIYFDFDRIGEFKSKMLIEEFYLTCCTIPGGHVLEEEQIEKLLLKGNVRRPPFDILKDYLEGNGHFIGKLFVSKREIARGRNRTVIFEGIYNNVHVAVKRLVHRRNAVALNYLRGLIELLQHPNVVHVIDVVMDDVFIYFAMERCTYNLYEFIQLCSKNMNRDSPQDRSIMRIVKKLCQPNGYPTPVLVKLIRDVVAGVAHLHALEFEYRDLRPQHVLISFEKPLCAKICDQGIIQGHGKLGSHRRPGWHSLEPLLGEHKIFAQQTWLPPRLGCEVDLFNLGCVIFFFITKGSHPFGPARKRDANIEKNCPDLALVEHIYEAAHLISNLLRPDREMRQWAILLYSLAKSKGRIESPFFWDSEKRGLFLQDVSAWVEHKDDNKNNFVNAMIDAAPKVLDGNWDIKLEALFLTFATSDKCYSYDSVLDLLLLIGNTLSRQQWLPKDIQVLIGSTHGEIYEYFASLFPSLFIDVYDFIDRERIYIHEKYF